jgi:hypothetical protein
MYCGDQLQQILIKITGIRGHWLPMYVPPLVSWPQKQGRVPAVESGWMVGVGCMTEIIEPYDKLCDASIYQAVQKRNLRSSACG